MVCNRVSSHYKHTKCKSLPEIPLKKANLSSIVAERLAPLWLGVFKLSRKFEKMKI